MPEQIVIPIDLKASRRVVRIVRIAAVALAQIADALEAPTLDELFEPGAETPPNVVFASGDPAGIRLASEVFGGKPPTAADAPSSAAAVSSTTAPVVAPASSTTPAVPVPPAPAAAQTTGETAPAAAAPAPASADSPRDKAGLPWDARIHSSGQSMNSGDGLWKRKRGVSEHTVALVEAELRAQLGLAAPVPAAVEVAPVIPAPPAAVEVAPVVPAAPAAAPAAGVSFVAVMGKVTALMSAGKLSQDDIARTCESVGGPGARLPDLSRMPDALAAFNAHLDALSLGG